MPSHALLLRLFLSPSFFSVHVALRYLLLYADNVGITYYLTGRLRQLDIHELRDVWGFVCHLLVTRPSKSRALECFIVEIAQRSTHIAMITLWFMQAALKDLSLARTDSQSFVICRRVLHKCHEIIFGDLPPPSTAPYAALSLPSQPRYPRTKVKPNVEPSLVGIGIVLAGASGMPLLAEAIGHVPIEQGRAEDDMNIRNVEAPADETATGGGSTQAFQVNVDDDDEEDVNDTPDTDGTPDATSVPHETGNTTRPGVLTRRRTVGAAQTVPALPLHLQRSRASEDPLGQLDTDNVAIPYLSSPSISSARPAPRSAAINFADALLETYDNESQLQLLRSHHCRSEVQFLLSLENISNRLLVVPRPARVSALRAELTALNHKLPAEVCMPMWCSSSDSPKLRGGISQPHHRIVRIPPGESVVLNSAERAPYLLLVEILNDDLDFDPRKRSNKEVLKKIVMKEHEQRGASKDLVPFNTLPTAWRETKSLTANNDAVRMLPVTPPVVVPHTATPASPFPTEDEEIDLVEQLYGSDQSLRTRPIDLSDSIVLPPAPKNKELDMVAWSRSSSVPSTPVMDDIPSSSRLSSTLPLSAVPNRSINDSSAQSIFQTKESFSDDREPTRILSLDEYSERMRTAAIMLAQLNASLARESAFPNGQTNNRQTGSSQAGSSWMLGSGWLNNAEQPSRKELALPDNLLQSLGRLKLQHAEASAIRDRIMKEMLALEEERMARMRENSEVGGTMNIGDVSNSLKTAEDETIIRRELNKADPSAVVFSESWAAKKSRIRQSSPYGHLATWDCVSVIVKTGGDLRQEQLAVQLIQEFQRIWEEESCSCWVRYFRILITGGMSGLVETITDAVSIHSIKKAEYARRIAEGRFGHVTLLDHFKSTYGHPTSAKFVRAQRNFAKSLAGYSLVTYLLQVKDRHNGNILLDRDGHLIHIDFGFILSNTPGNIGFEAAPFKLPPEYIEILGGVDAPAFLEFRRLFRQGFEASRKHCDRIITLVELMQKDSTLPCFAAFGVQTANQLRDRFQPALTHSLVGGYVDRLIDSSLGSHWTRLYDSYQYYSQSIL